jgi:hypothetical protein
VNNAIKLFHFKNCLPVVNCYLWNDKNNEQYKSISSVLKEIQIREWAYTDLWIYTRGGIRCLGRVSIPCWPAESAPLYIIITHVLPPSENCEIHAVHMSDEFVDSLNRHIDMIWSFMFSICMTLWWFILKKVIVLRYFVLKKSLLMRSNWTDDNY